MAGRRATTILAATVWSVLAIGLALAPASAENVPLPTPAPQPKTGAAPGTVPPPPVNNARPPAASDAAPSRPGFFPFSFMDKGGPAPQTTTAFDAKQRATLDRISLYLSSVQTMVGNFVQVGPDGGKTQGTFYIQKPGKVRFEYNPLSQTPLRYLLADRIDILRDTDVISVTSDDTFVTAVIEEKQLVVGTSRLMIMFDAKDLALKQWTVTDPQGLDTTVAVFNLDATKKPDPNLFVINYQRNTGAN
jgi:outer membrane lipoprotein-sorting protein